MEFGKPKRETVNLGGGKQRVTVEKMTLKNWWGKLSDWEV